jgi:PIN domain nuclease of toxin-antitoxin system
VRVLLDTQVVLWWMSDDARLGERACAVIGDMRNDVLVSAATAFEISTKQAIGKLEAPDDLGQQLEDLAFAELPVTVAHCAEVRTLPMIHMDPFDRLLVAQARREGLVLMTADRTLSRYDVRTMPAGS